MSPFIARTIADLRAAVADLRKQGARIGLAPTMGALHAGHVALTDVARAAGADRLVVSIFVNPTQFAPHEDFAKYPRSFEADVEKLAAAGVDVVYAPTPETMYPDGFATTITPGGPALAGLEDRFRPTHFAGVATVVAKLFTQCAPDLAVFGEKDFQQLAVIRRMSADLDLPVRIVGAPTVREADGLALSSRNVYLSAQERAQAPALHAALQDCASRLRAGAPAQDALALAQGAIEKAGFTLDYLELRDAESLGAPAAGGRWRLLAAARLGGTRLIDNIDARGP
ncbi:MAG: pantoate--beta-alanine ligase [Beijerinckiaceae bacterium]